VSPAYKAHAHRTTASGTTLGSILSSGRVDQPVRNIGALPFPRGGHGVKGADKNGCLGSFIPLAHSVSEGSQSGIGMFFKVRAAKKQNK
jgi:hypothetical protein